MGKPGLYQIGKGRRPKRRTRATLADIAAAASTRKRSTNPGQPQNMNNARNVASLWGQPIPKGRRCKFVHKAAKGGHQCKAWALKGARYCWHHGGLLDVPNHPSAVKALPHIEAEQARRSAQKELRDHDPHIVELIRQSIAKARDSNTAPAGDTLEGVKAYIQDDNGKAFRRWKAQLTSPADQQRNRKPAGKRASD